MGCENLIIIHKKWEDWQPMVPVQEINQSIVKLLLSMYYQVKYNLNIKKLNAKCYSVKVLLPNSRKHHY